MLANAEVDAYETSLHGHIKGATKAKSECGCFLLPKRIKGAPSLIMGLAVRDSVMWRWCTIISVRAMTVFLII